MSLRRRDRDRFVTALFAPADRREDLFTLYEFNQEIARVRETVSEAMLGQIRLQWWRENIGAAGHPTAESLGELLTRHPGLRPFIDRLIDAREFDLLDRPLADEAELKSYVEDSAAALTEAACLLLGAADAATLEAAREVGRGWGLLGLMRAQPVLGRLPEIEGKTLADQVRSHLKAARKQRVDRAALPALLPAKLADSYLKSFRKAGNDLANREWSAQNSRPLRLLLANSLGRF